MELPELILHSRSARADIGVLEAFLGGSVEGMLGEGLRFWKGPRLAESSALYGDFTARLKENFLTENLVTPAVDNHVDAVLGREIDWTLLRGGAELKTESEAVKAWYYDRRVQATLYDAARTLLYADTGEGRTASALRLYVPRRALTDAGVPLRPLPESLRRAVRLEHPSGTVCGVLREDGDPYAGWYVYTERSGSESRNVLELTALDTEFVRQGWTRKDGAASTQGLTVVQLRTGAKWETILGEAVYPLGGHLTVAELSRDTLLTPDVISQQAGLNTSWSYLNRYASGAAFLERIFTNALPPGRWVNERGEPDPDGKIYEPGEYATGPGTSNFLGGVPGDDGRPASVGVHFREPSSGAMMLENIREHRYAIMNAVNQLHRLISGDATASGLSRIQAKADFSVSLRPTEQQMKYGAKWTLESALRLAGYFETGRAAYEDAEFDVKLFVSAGDPTPEEQDAAIKLYDAGFIDQQEGMRRVGVQDTVTMAQSVQAEAAVRFRQQQELARLRGPQVVEPAA